MFFENAKKNGSGKFQAHIDHGKLRKWTILRSGKDSQELLQLIALGCGGVSFVPQLPSDLSHLLRNRTRPLRIEFMLGCHAPGECDIGQHPTLGSGVQVDPDGSVRHIRKKDSRHLPSKLRIRKPAMGTGNLHYFLLGYGPQLSPRNDVDVYDFSDPFHRIVRFHSLFSPHARVTDPVLFLEKLHYKAVLKSRFPAKLSMRRLRHLLQEHLAIDTMPWIEKGCDFEKEWNVLRPWQQRVVLPLLDALRHVMDASPKIGKPLDKSGIVLMNRPDRFCPPTVSPRWIGVLDRLFPNMQFIVNLAEKAASDFPVPIRRKRLQLPLPTKQKQPMRRCRPPRGAILLVDVDSRLPNLALMKLSSYFKKQGKRVVIAGKDWFIKGVKTVYASCVFFTPQSRNKVTKLRDFYGKRIDVAGSGVDLKRRLPEEIENATADFGLYPELKDRAIGFLTRGCPFECPFCIVPIKEGKTRQVSDLDELLQGRHKLILLDDNILSHPKAAEFLEEMVRRDIQVNFNQTLDIRLVNKKNARLLRQLRCSNVRFSRHVYHFSMNSLRDMELIRRKYHQLGFGNSDNVEFICMYGYNTTLAEDVRRFCFLRALPGAYVFVQCYKPIPGGPHPDLSDFFDDDADKHIDELIKIVFPQNMKSMEKYYRWLSKSYAQTFGKLHEGLVDTIFRYNYRHRKGRYISSLARLRKM